MESLTWDNNYGRGPLVFFVPDEICLVVTGSRGETVTTRHERILNAHNERLTRIVKESAHPQALVDSLGLPERFHKDLAPHPKTLEFLHTKAHHGANILNLLPASNVRPHAFIIPTSGGQSEDDTLVLTQHCYHIGDRNDHRGSTDERARRVRDLAILSNLIFRNERTSMRAVPNWLAATTDDGCPGPASAPQWTPDVQLGAGYWSFVFPKPEVAEIVAHGRTHPSVVKIAVLDTAPSAATVRHAAHAYPDNLLLQHIANDSNVTIDRQLPDPTHNLAHLADVNANWRDLGVRNREEPSPATLEMNDHGLFITGIIHDIAPNADVSLVRVLSGYGVTDHHAMIHALTQLPQLLDNDQQRLVVNLSLGFAIPPGIEALRLWLLETYQALEKDLGPNLTLASAIEELGGDDPRLPGKLEQILEDMRAGLNDVITWLGQHPQVLVVAAAGNDNRFFGQRAQRPEPRWPARYTEVLSVAAVDREQQPADYSNRGDVPPDTNGIATYGGDATVAKDGDLGVIGLDADPVDAIKGIYSADKLTLGAGANETGWVYWSGTSFSTPIITGLAADLWDMRLTERRANPSLPSYSPQDLIDELVNTFYSTPRDDTDTDSLSTPTIATEQRWVTAWKGRV